MAALSIFRSRNGTIFLVPFTFDKKWCGGNVAKGKTEHFTTEEFLQRGGERVLFLLDHFYVRDSLAEKSELYQEMPKNERERFLREHEHLTVFTDSRGSLIADGHAYPLYGQVEEKFDMSAGQRATAEWILNLFDRCARG